ncbi:DUF6099 family protein [Streptomyces sp. NPDC088354]|uniref:DUF6099 family protein n=1 Tax=unclassified Streptomyces TaxID=2593676 RepID=UPI0029B5337D|nr:DUF6099 family protein [Streptomyces sp. MI02-7b]MDX3072365.1 DUF6099 family protein [Streptomyces sp. MI02-7b]
MDAVRLIRATRRALQGGGAERDLMAEAWQAQALTQAIGSHLALHGAPELRTLGFWVCEASGRACGSTGPPGASAGPLRAAILTEVREPAGALRELRELLAELCMALVSVACTAESETEYWQCIEAVDAADESKDRVGALLRAVESSQRHSV